MEGFLSSWTKDCSLNLVNPLNKRSMVKEDEHGYNLRFRKGIYSLMRKVWEMKKIPMNVSRK